MRKKEAAEAEAEAAVAVVVAVIPLSQTLSLLLEHSGLVCWSPSSSSRSSPGVRRLNKNKAFFVLVFRDSIDLVLVRDTGIFRIVHTLKYNSEIDTYIYIYIVSR